MQMFTTVPPWSGSPSTRYREVCGCTCMCMLVFVCLCVCGWRIVFCVQVLAHSLTPSFITNKRFHSHRLSSSLPFRTSIIFKIFVYTISHVHFIFCLQTNRNKQVTYSILGIYGSKLHFSLSPEINWRRRQSSMSGLETLSSSNSFCQLSILLLSAEIKKTHVESISELKRTEVKISGTLPVHLKMETRAPRMQMVTR